MYYIVSWYFVYLAGSMFVLNVVSFVNNYSKRIWSTLCLDTLYILKVNWVIRHVLDWAPDESNTNQPICRKASIHLECDHTTVVADFDLDCQNILEPGIAWSCSLGVCPFKDNIFFDEIDQMAQDRHNDDFCCLAWNVLIC